MTEIYLCSFASKDLSRSRYRFIEQAEKLKLYKRIKVFGPKDLNKFKKKQIENFLKKGEKRLYGYGCWKPYIIRLFLDQVPKNSIVQYTDIGCHFNSKGVSRLNDYVNICKKKNILSFQYKKPKFKKFNTFKFQEYIENEYTKADLWKYLKIKNSSAILKNEQILSGVIFFKNNEFTRNILNQWSKYSDINNLIDNSMSKNKNHSNFIEHRHDQSIFSLLCKKNKVFSLSASECEWAEYKNRRVRSHISNFPIHAKRDKKYNFFKRFMIRQVKNFKRKVNNAKN